MEKFCLWTVASRPSPESPPAPPDGPAPGVRTCPGSPHKYISRFLVVSPCVSPLPLLLAWYPGDPLWRTPPSWTTPSFSRCRGIHRNCAGSGTENYSSSGKASAVKTASSQAGNAPYCEGISGFRFSTWRVSSVDICGEGPYTVCVWFWILRTLSEFSVL